MSLEGKGSLSLENYRYTSRYVLSKRLVHHLDKLSYQLGVRDAQALSLPDFMCVGFRKAGTTWLYENLHYHPDIYLPLYKNVRYFSKYFDRPLAQYAAQFAPGTKKVKGDFSNSYSALSKRHIRFIRSVMPEVKIIFMLRNPVERAWSEFVHSVAATDKSLASFTDEEMMHALQCGTVERAGGYTAVIDTWLTAFPYEQVFVGFYDDLALRPQTLLSDLFSFLSVSKEVDWARFPYDECIVPPVGEQYENCNGWRGVFAPEHRNTAELLEERYKASKTFLLDYLQPELVRLEQQFGPRVKAWFD